MDLARGLKKVWKKKGTVITVIIRVLCTFLKNLVRRPERLEIGGRIGTIETTYF